MALLGGSVPRAVKEFTKRRKCRESSFYSLSKRGEEHGVERDPSTGEWGL